MIYHILLVMHLSRFHCDIFPAKKFQEFQVQSGQKKDTKKVTKPKDQKPKEAAKDDKPEAAEEPPKPKPARDPFAELPAG